MLGQRAEAADGRVCAGTDAQIRAVRVTVRRAGNVRVEPQALMGRRQVIEVWPHRADDEVRARRGELELQCDPVGRHHGVGIRVRDPHALREQIAQGHQTRRDALGARRADCPRVRADDGERMPGRDVGRIIGARVEHDADFAGNGRPRDRGGH